MSEYIRFPSGFDEADLPGPDDVERLRTIVNSSFPATRQTVREEYGFLLRAFDAAAPSVLKKHLGEELNKQLITRRRELREWLERNPLEGTVH